MSFPMTVSRCRRVPMISLSSTFLATVAILRDVETKQPEFAFFKDCGKIMIFDGVFVQKNVEQICKSFLLHYNITQAHIDNFTCRLLILCLSKEFVME
jgi:hypothetical protein